MRQFGLGGYAWEEPVHGGTGEATVIGSSSEQSATKGDRSSAPVALDVSEEVLDFRMMAEHTTDIVLRVALDGVIEWVSPNITEVLGWAPEDWVGRPNTEMVRPDHREEFLTQVREVRESGGDSRFEFPVLRGDGSSLWMESNDRLATTDGRPPYRVVRLRDIEVQHEAIERLADSEEVFRKAMADAPIGMCLVAPGGAFIKVNDALCELLGRDRDTLQATTWQEMTHPDDVAADQRLVDEVIAGEREGYRLRKRYLRPDGEVVWGDLSVSGVGVATGGYGS